MRILICAKNDLPALVAVNQLADALAGHDVTFWLSDITRPLERERAELDLLRFFERELPLAWLLPLREAAGAQGAGHGPWQDFAALGRRLGAPVRVVPRLREVEADFRALAPDLVISIRFSHIFPASFLEVPRHGILNVHPGYLPEYAGLFAPFHQLVGGRARIGCTVHYVDAGIDTGPVVEITSLPVEPRRSLQWHVVNVYPTAIPVLRRAIATLAEGGAVPATPQDQGRRTYWHLPDSAEIEAFQQRFRLIAPDDFAEIMAGFGLGPQAVAAAESAAAGPARATAT
ncbi:Formyl transferase [Tistlia consotensis]|uniref:Formyl transferase n=1 Tax=Tistlia consotensis USBA 355 TaxID=560819 RepID=A0A1Y6CQG2_9PROT|nr:formyltransferase family protein [Tistlia consotensis]SMF81268.1 Formyl transferase [Tistlia consotensis USBA 355]SNS23100.1 Formyl transferase [Tistlia consotensis]